MPRKAKAADTVESAQDAATAAQTTDKPGSEPPEEVAEKKPKAKVRRIGKKKASGPAPETSSSANDTSGEIVVNNRQAFFGLNFNKLDKNLSPDEQREWNAIYASFRAGSLLTGKVAGVDIIRDGDKRLTCLIVFDYRVKILIPESEVWPDEDAPRPAHVLRRFLGAEVDYVVTEVYREDGWVLASRRKAMQYRRKSFRKHNYHPGDLVDCRVLAAIPSKLLVECGGYEATMAHQNISYGKVLDLREDYHPGQIVKAVYKGLDDGKIRLSIKEVNPHPFDNVELRHPLHSRRVSRVVGKYAGGVFCELEKGYSCLCLYSPEQQDSDFDLGDDVIIVVTAFDYENKFVYGRIVTGW